MISCAPTGFAYETYKPIPLSVANLHMSSNSFVLALPPIKTVDKIKFKPAGKRHGMSKRSNKFIRNTKKSSIMAPSDAALIDHMLPYNK